jgi:ArsR family transcriptional regulator
MKSVLFVCTANSIRSQMAEALLRHYASDVFRIVSAGSEPQAIDPRTLETLCEQHIPTEGLSTKSIDTLAEQHFDFVISLCSRARQECQNWPGSGVILAWDLPDPKSSLDPQAFLKTFFAIEKRIRAFIEINTQAGELVSESLSPTEFYKALADDIRLISLMLIQEKGELCVCELMAALEESQPKISRHLAQLRKSGLLIDKRRKQWVYYRLHPLMHDWMRQVLSTTREHNPKLLEAPLSRLQAMSEPNNERLSA